MRQRLIRIALGIGATTFSLLTMWSWGHSSPVGSSPDEGFHLVSMWCGPDELIVDCKKDEANPSNYLVPALMAEPWLCFYGRSDQSAECQGEATAGKRLSVSFYNTTEYPPYYYSIARNIVSEDIVSSVLDIRMINSLVGIVIVALALALNAHRGWTLSMLALALAVPLAVFFVPSVNPTGLAISGVVAFTLSATAMVQREQSFRHLAAPAILFAISSLLSLGSRRDAIAYCVLIGAAVIAMDSVSRFRNRQSFRSAIRTVALRPANVLIGVTSAILAILFVRSGIGSVVTAGLDGNVEGRDSTTVLFTNLVDLPKFFGGFFVGPGWGLGWLDTPMPLIVPVGAIMAVILLFRPSLVDAGVPARLLLLANAVVISILALTALQADLRYVGESVQPRYLYPLFVASMLLVGSRSRIKVGTPAVAVAGTVIVIAHSIALRTNLRRYTTGLDVRAWRLDDPLEWWWSNGPTPTAIWIAGTAGFACAFALCAVGSRLFGAEDRSVSDAAA
jgi:hypothetical protein